MDNPNTWKGETITARSFHQVFAASSVKFGIDRLSGGGERLENTGRGRSNSSSSMKASGALRRAIQSASARLFPGVSARSEGVTVDEVALVAKTLNRRRGPNRVMIDVGAHFGTALSWFVDLGWSVYAFEPDLENRAELTRRFGHAPTLRIDSRAVSDEASGGEAFYRSSVSTGISSLSAFHDTHERADDVEVTTLQHICEEFGLGRVDVLKVDVEGLDLAVLRGNDWSAVTPEIVVCEFEDRKSRQLGYRFDDLCEYLIERSYRLVISEWYPVNEYGVRHRFRRAAIYPTRLRHPDSWGNVIATRTRATQLRLFLRLWVGSTAARILSSLLNLGSREA